MGRCGLFGDIFFSCSRATGQRKNAAGNRQRHSPRRARIAVRALARAARRADDATVGQHHRERQHVLPHGAVAHGVGAGGAGGGHAAQRGIRAGVDGEEQALVADVFIELLAGDAGLHADVKVHGVHFQHLVQLNNKRPSIHQKLILVHIFVFALPYHIK